jgi:hypothetical protein
MSEEITEQINQVAELIKAGKLAQARNILIPFLRDNAQVAEAWYLLSFTLKNPDKQSYAIEQALKIAPNFEKAGDRKNQLIEGKDADVEIDPQLSEAAIENQDSAWQVSSKTKPLPKLAEEEPGEFVDDLREELNRDSSSITSPFYDSTFTEEEEEETPKEEKKVSKNAPNLRRRLILLLASIVLILLLVVGLPSFENAEPNNVEVVGTAEPIAPQGFRTLPATWTPSR